MSFSGVILTQPDYRLSLQLKFYESIEKGDVATEHYLRTYQWMNENVRNILDESDAILQPNYQLIYTMGDHQLPDGSPQRWMVIQAILKRVPRHMKTLFNEYKTAVNKESLVEFDDKYLENGRIFGHKEVEHRTDVFPQCRILNETAFNELKSKLTGDFFEGKLDVAFPLHEIDAATKNRLKILLMERKPDERSTEILQRFQEKDKNTILILSGLLRFEVLKLALTKRWRVNYGVDLQGQRKMAIPFKAKDLPADSEFGHTDVAICFTQLSYYYSGWRFSCTIN